MYYAAVQRSGSIPGDHERFIQWLYNHYSHVNPSEFACVHVDAEVAPGSHSDPIGALLYVVEGDCRYAALPCKPYIDGYELTWCCLY